MIKLGLGIDEEEEIVPEPSTSDIPDAGAVDDTARMEEVD